MANGGENQEQRKRTFSTKVPFRSRWTSAHRSHEWQLSSPQADGALQGSPSTPNRSHHPPDTRTTRATWTPGVQARGWGSSWGWQSSQCPAKRHHPKPATENLPHSSPHVIHAEGCPEEFPPLPTEESSRIAPSVLRPTPSSAPECTLGPSGAFPGASTAPGEPSWHQ